MQMRGWISLHGINHGCFFFSQTSRASYKLELWFPPFIRVNNFQMYIPLEDFFSFFQVSYMVHVKTFFLPSTKTSFLRNCCGLGRDVFGAESWEDSILNWRWLAIHMELLWEIYTDALKLIQLQPETTYQKDSTSDLAKSAIFVSITH
jgi:hypothetical protein